MATVPTPERMSFGATFGGERYTEGHWSVTVAGRNRVLRLRLREGWSAVDHLFDRVLAAVDAVVTAKSSWSSRAALERAVYLAAARAVIAGPRFDFILEP